MEPKSPQKRNIGPKKMAGWTQKDLLIGSIGDMGKYARNLMARGYL